MFAALCKSNVVSVYIDLHTNDRSVATMDQTNFLSLLLLAGWQFREDIPAALNIWFFPVLTVPSEIYTRVGPFAPSMAHLQQRNCQ